IQVLIVIGIVRRTRRSLLVYKIRRAPETAVVSEIEKTERGKGGIESMLCRSHLRRHAGRRLCRVAPHASVRKTAFEDILRTRKQQCVLLRRNSREVKIVVRLGDR